MLNRSLFLAGCLAIAAPAAALEMEAIGTLNAEFDGQVITQETILVTDDGETTATAEVHQFGPITTISIYGGASDQLSLEMTYASRPDAQTAPLDLTISYFQNGFRQFWTSEEAPTTPDIRFITLEIGEEEGRAEGSFEALLCRVDGFGAEPDTSDCKPIRGSFATRLFLAAD